MGKTLPAQKQTDIWELQTHGNGRTDLYQDAHEDGYKPGVLEKCSSLHLH